MTAGLTSLLDTPLGLYAVDLLFDETDPTATGWTRWDRETLTGEAAVVDLLGVPQVQYGRADLSVGDDVLASFTSLVYDDPGGLVRTFLRVGDGGGPIDPAALYVRYRSVDAEFTLDWFGRVQSSGRRRPVSRATRGGRTTVEAACGLGPLAGVPAEPTAGVPIGDLIARLVFAANPHLPLRVALDVSASGQYVFDSGPSDGFTSARHLRATHEWAGKAFLAERSDESLEAAEGDYGERREVLDAIAAAGGLRIFQSASTGEWLAVPRAAVGEALPGAERAVRYPAVDGGPVWSLPGVAPLAARVVVPVASDLRDEDGDAADEVPRLAAVIVDAGASNLVGPGFPGGGTLADGEERSVRLIVIAPVPNVRARVVVEVHEYDVASHADPGDPDDLRYPGAARLLLTETDDGVDYWLADDGTWDTSPREFGGGVASFEVTASEDFPALGRLVAFAVGETVTGDLTEYALFEGFEVRLYDGDGDPIVSWRVSLGDAEGVGEVEDADLTPGTAHDTDGTSTGGGAGTWADTASYRSARWGSTPAYLVEYGAEAALRVRGEPATAAGGLDALDGAVHGLHGPEVRVLLDLDDLDRQPERAPYVVGAGCTLDPGAGRTVGVWTRLPADAASANDSYAVETAAT